MSQPKIAVSGSSGFVGSSVCSALQSAGYEVTKLSRSQPDTERIISWSPADGLKTPSRLSGLDAVVHLAGKSIACRWTKTAKQKIRESRVCATQILAEQIAALASPPPVIISASATGIYGSRGDEVLDESAVLGDDYLAMIAKAWESACDPLRDRGLRVMHPRFGMILSASGAALQSMLPIFQWCLGGKLGSGNQYWPWISLDDCVSGILASLHRKELHGAINFVAPESVTNAEFTEALAKAIRRPAVLPAPKFALRLLMGEMADALLLSSCRARPKRLLDAGFEFANPKLATFLQKTYRVVEVR
ncbi:MAG: TIGR01777 family oxidoreductase [Planctomycetota bacterium]|nr:TIGR01777 family oxidoreductase [Planctomycetota bacterium]